ncbi:S8 family serine peptidase [Exiguobacterium sp. SL-9]|uniref:S8 family peptidase n=1 Tax=Exiguobacterium sp. SL-9 TaxID=2510963 RepID=UPI00103EF39A|nr:S8 family serine peptidase [Exiguobacterium sp. SL-9]TCI22531.1 hypothetical protein EVJ34_07925 [Exiguobacterium sp. SL-9]
MKKIIILLCVFWGWNTYASAEDTLIVEREIGEPLAGEEILYEGIDRVIVSIPAPSISTKTNIEQLDEVLDVSEDGVIKREGVVSRYQPYIGSLNISPVWSNHRGEGVTVAIIDDGIDVNHPEFRGRIVSPYDATRDVYRMVDKGVHGTHVAGIIGSTFDDQGNVGVAPNVSLMPIDVFEGDDSSISDVLKGIHHAVLNGARVVNMSFGTYERNAALESAIRDARRQGLVFVGAAGNEDTDERFYPAAYSDVLAVGAVTVDDQITDFTNYGTFIDVVAPGEDIYSTLPNGRYGFMSGTSMATPIASGIAALLISKEPKLSPGMVYARLKATAVDLGEPGKDVLYGYGRVTGKATNFALSDFNLLRDITPPAKPSLGKLTNKSTAITGKSESGSTVQIFYRGKMYTHSANNGSYRMNVSKLKVGSQVTIVARDKAFNPSIPITRTVFGVFDKPSFQSVSSTSSIIRGSGKKYATVQAFVGNKPISRVVRIKGNGQFAISIPKQRKGKVVVVKMKSPLYLSESYSLVVR